MNPAHRPESPVAVADFQVWYQHCTQDCPLTSDGDFNHDAMIDGTDFLLWYTAAGTTAQPLLDSLHLDYATLAAIQAPLPPPAPTPEPTTLLLTLATPLLLSRRLRP